MKDKEDSASEIVSVGPLFYPWINSSSSTPTAHFPLWGVLPVLPSPSPYWEKRSSVSVISFPSWPEDPTGRRFVFTISRRAVPSLSGLAVPGPLALPYTTRFVQDLDGPGRNRKMMRLGSKAKSLVCFAPAAYLYSCCDQLQLDTIIASQCALAHLVYTRSALVSLARSTILLVINVMLRVTNWKGTKGMEQQQQQNSGDCSNNNRRRLWRGIL